MRVILAILVSMIALLFVGCAPTGEEFHKAGVTAAEKADDVEYCDAYAIGHRRGSDYGGLAGAAGLIEQRKALFTTCMMDRGYRKHRN